MLRFCAYLNSDSGAIQCKHMLSTAWVFRHGMCDRMCMCVCVVFKVKEAERNERKSGSNERLNEWLRRKCAWDVVYFEINLQPVILDIFLSWISFASIRPQRPTISLHCVSWISAMDVRYSRGCVYPEHERRWLMHRTTRPTTTVMTLVIWSNHGSPHRLLLTHRLASQPVCTCSLKIWPLRVASIIHLISVILFALPFLPLSLLLFVRKKGEKTETTAKTAKIKRYTLVLSLYFHCCTPTFISIFTQNKTEMK